jgi:ribose 5-phosphate isomerase A
MKRILLCALGGASVATMFEFVPHDPSRYALRTHMDPKQRAAEAALEMLADDMVVGLGTGSTVDFFLVALAQSIKAGRLCNIRGVPTSRRSEQRAAELGIALTTLAESPAPDITIDGADEIAPNLDLIKGLGGALLREKIVAQSSKKLVIIADASKTVTALGSHQPLPVEAASFGHETHAGFLRSLGCAPTLRRQTDGSPFITDNSNVIYDCRFPRIDDPRRLELKLKSRTGIVESGLFLGMTHLALIAGDADVKRIYPSSS